MQERSFSTVAERCLAGLWSFAEAVVFFIVADVPVTVIALRHGFFRAAGTAVVASLAAVPGGALLWWWAARDPEMVRNVLVALPGIGPEIIGKAEGAMEAGGIPAAFHGSFSGMPYKLYVFAGAETGKSAALFLMLTPLIRLPRFLLAAALASGAGRLSGRVPVRVRIGILAGFWIAFYAWYFTVMGG